MALTLPALRFEAEAFQLGADKILGRQSAGDAFLRAALALPELDAITGCGPNPAGAKPFAAMVAAHRRGLTANWIGTGSHQALAGIGALHFPDPSLPAQARSRLAVGSNAYSLSGVTHTIASAGIMRNFADFAAAPLMEWDGVICTSDAVKASVLEILDEQDDYLAWRMPGARPAPRLQLPVIPLGVHGDAFAFGEGQRAEARKVLGIGAGDVAFLFVGRLSFHAKANPFPMYAALEQAARSTGKRIALIQCGWFANDAIARVFKEGAARHAPSVRHLWLDGRKPAERDRAWAAGDVFISLSDNIQETFGLTPLEAMAAGLPVIVTDWDGYRQTVRHGQTGFMVPTYAPRAGLGEGYAALHATDAINYDHYLALTARHVSVNMAALEKAVRLLVTQPARRRAMGEAGRRLARAEFEWSGLIRRYIAFWDELAAIRRSALPDDPRTMARIAADRLDPFRIFANYPTQAIGPQTRLRERRGGGAFTSLLADPMFSQWRGTLPPDDAFSALIAAFGGTKGKPVAEAAAAIGMPGDTAQLVATLLLKTGTLEVC